MNDGKREIKREKGRKQQAKRKGKRKIENERKKEPFKFSAAAKTNNLFS